MMPFDNTSYNGSEVSKPTGRSGLRLKQPMWILILAALAMWLLPVSPEAAIITKKWGECTTCDYKSVSQDSYIDGQSTKFNHGADQEVRVGRKDTATDPDRPTRGLIKFNFSNISISAASQITSAKLYAYIHNREGSNLVDAHRVLKTWNRWMSKSVSSEET